VILVTGAGDGIGRAVAKALARQGASVVLLGRTQRKLARVYDEILAAGGPKPALAPLDLETADATHYDALTAAIDGEFGRLDGLAHVAGILGTRSPIELFDVPTWCKVVHVNLTAPFILTQVCLPLLKRSTDAAIVFTSSSVGRRGRAYWGAYAVSKFGIEGLSQVLADETEHDGLIRVNALNPGKVKTHMRLQAYPAEDRSVLAEPDDIVGPYLYLLGAQSRGVTGQSFDCER